MSKSQPDIRIRHAVATWSEDSPRGAVSAFCRKHNVSRAWFYRVRAAAAEVGPVKALEKKSTLPRTTPTSTAPAMIELLLGTREELHESGLDHGPLPVIAKLSRQGFKPPSRATVARIFVRAGVVVPEPRKKPRSAYKRFVYPQPNACWQIDSTQWQLADESHPPRPHGGARGVPQGQGRGADHGQTLQTNHSGQERTLPSDTAPIPAPATTCILNGRPATPG